MNAPSWITPDWPAPPRVHAATTTRIGGSSRAPFDSLNLGARTGDDALSVTDNRTRLAQALRLPQTPRWLVQVHGVRVVSAGTVDRDATRADASVTDQPGIVCAVLTADCLPVLLCDRTGTQVAAAHAGWRGLAGGILENTVAAMTGPPEEIIAWLGPAIGPHAYEVGDDVREACLLADPGAGDCFRAVREGHWLADLYALARRRLSSAGVGSIHGGGLCTYADTERFFSYRRDGRTGRMASLIWRE